MILTLTDTLEETKAQDLTFHTLSFTLTSTMADMSTVFIKTVPYITETSSFSIERMAMIRDVVPITSEILPTGTIHSAPAVEARVEPRHDVNVLVYCCVIAAVVTFFAGYRFNQLSHEKDMRRRSGGDEEAAGDDGSVFGNPSRDWRGWARGERIRAPRLEGLYDESKLCSVLKLKNG